MLAEYSGEMLFIKDEVKTLREELDETKRKLSRLDAATYMVQEDGPFSDWQNNWIHISYMI